MAKRKNLDAFESEVDLAAAVKAWLIDQDWDVYPEVQLYRYGTVADLVAKRGRIVWIVETKLRLNTKVVEQVYRQMWNANYISCAVSASSSFILERILREWGIGLIVSDRFNTCERIRPKLRREHQTSVQQLRDALHAGHKEMGVAGSAGGKHWTPFNETKRTVVDYVQKHPGCTFKELLGDIRTHYASIASARTSLSKWIDRGIIPGVRSEGTNCLRLYYDAEGGSNG